MKLNKVSLFSLLSIFIILFSACHSQKHRITFADIVYPKREFRGAWLSTAWQSRYRTMNSEQMKTYFSESLDKLQEMGFNAIIFQVRPQSDAFYKSKYEPWSAHLSGTQGVAPDNGFDPLEYITAECHKRNMELHAWLNPYRVTTSLKDSLVPSHLFYKEPERFVNYGDKIYFNPGIPKNREFICKVVKDIVLNYKVDAIHMDDYFYPYPINGVPFPDQDTFAEYRDEQGFGEGELSDWRRNNVNLLIKEIKETLLETKPWVRFGVSPFGIYTNKKASNIEGSETNGLQNYDDLYADVKLWVKEGWVDYNMPQLYWEMGHKAADYTTLIKWWSEHNFEQPLYIGQDVRRSMDAVNKVGASQLSEKIMLTRTLPNISGNCFWPAYELLDNYKNVDAVLKKEFYSHPAIIPAYTHMSNNEPKKVSKLKEEKAPDGKRILTWTSNHEENNPESAQYYVVYIFGEKEKESVELASRIVAITDKTYYVLPERKDNQKVKYVVTAFDSFHNESKPQTKKLKK